MVAILKSQWSFPSVRVSDDVHHFLRTGDLSHRAGGYGHQLDEVWKQNAINNTLNIY